MHSMHEAAANAHAAELRRRATRNHGHQVVPPMRRRHWPRVVRAAIAVRTARVLIGRPATAHVRREPGA
jgi:hypothetical protein